MSERVKAKSCTFAELLRDCFANFKDIVKLSVTEDEAVTMLYSSKLYTILEQEETKAWYYSTDMLYSLFEHEQKNGQLIFPDV